MPGLRPRTPAADSRSRIRGVVAGAGPVGSRWASARRPPRGSVPYEAGDVEDLLRMEQVVEGPAQLVGQRRQRLGLAQPGGQALQVGADLVVLLGAEHGRLGEGPLQPGV